MRQVAIHEVLENALSFDPKVRLPVSDLRAAVAELFDRLDQMGATYALVGGIALLSFVEGRNTEDIDLIMNPEEAQAAFPDLVIHDRDFGNASFRSVKVDLLLTTNALFREVLGAERGTLEFGDRKIPSTTREGMLVLKLYALPSLYRQGKLDRAALYETDILMLRRGVELDEERLLARVAPHLAPHDVAELRNILREQRERSRFTT